MPVSKRPSQIRLLALGAIAAAVLAGSGGAMSLALFTDDATLDNNSFSTGTIVLTSAPSTALFNVTGMMPGDDEYGQLTVTNAGSAELRYSMSTSATDPDTKALAGKLTAEIRVKAAGSCASDFTGSVAMAETTMSSAAFGDPNAGQDTGDRLLASGNEVLCFKVSLAGDADNQYQGATTVATFTFEAEQTANNL